MAADPTPGAHLKAWLFAVLLLAAPAQAAVIEVPGEASLHEAIARAEPSDVVQLAPGTHQLDRKVIVDQPGPVVVRGPARIRSRVVEAFLVRAPDWTFEALTVEGACARQHDCEHAFHIVGAADRTVLRNLRLIDFNAQVKGNGDGRGAFPDDVLIADSVLFNRTIRDTDRPVALIDVVGGQRWTVRGNVIADFAQGRGRGVGYGAFLKGGSRDALIERNVVVCEHRHSGGFRIGLSLGGSGGESPPICEDGRCRPRHHGGVVRHNVVLNCVRDAGLYLNAAAATRVERNTLYDARGVDVRFPVASAEFVGNVISGGVLARDGAAAQVGPENLVAGSPDGVVFPTLRRDDDQPVPPETPAPPAAAAEALGRDRLRQAMRDAEAGDFCLRERPDLGAEICDARAALARLAEDQ